MRSSNPLRSAELSSLVEAPPCLPSGNEKISGWLIAGTGAFLFFWAVFHVALFYLLFANGVILEIFLGILRQVMVPGSAQGPRPEVFSWVPAFQTGVIVSGLAGLPTGLAISWKSKRKILLLIGAGLFVLGLLAGALAIVLLLNSALAI